jgi:predicted aldo/keto reductase-like oxidoreductase
MIRKPDPDCAGTTSSTRDWTRRDFLGESVRRGSALSAGLALPGLGLDGPLLAAGPATTAAQDTPLGIRRRGTLGRTGIEIPDISFGTFSLEHDEKLVLHALDRGVTHFDTAEGYTEGRAEEVLGRALRGRRHEVTLTSKFWANPDHSAAHQMKVLETSLRRLGTDYVDLYLNHAVNEIERLDSPEWQAFAERAKQEGKIRAIGMSGHSGRLVDCLAHAIDRKLVDVILVAYNFSQTPSYQEQVKRYLQDLAASFDFVTTQPLLPEMLRRAKAAGIGVMVMKTLQGARKNDMRPFEGPGRTFAQAAFRWVLAEPAIDGLVVSMTSRVMVDEYVEASGSGPPDLADLALLARYESRHAATSCVVGCGDCVSACPAQVAIPDVMRTRMYARDYGIPAIAARAYGAIGVNAAACLACSGEPCANACPRGIPIAAWNRETHRSLG